MKASPTIVRLLLALLAVGAAVFWQFVAHPRGWSIVEEQVRDRLQRTVLVADPETRVTVVDIDENSLKALGPWPLPRARIADLIETLVADYGAAAVGLDMVFPDKAEPGGDARLASLAAHGPVRLAVAFDYVRRAVPLEHGSAGRPPGATKGAGRVEASGYIGNHRSFGGNACTGNIGFVSDDDGVLRRLPWTTGYKDAAYLPLSATLLSRCDGAGYASAAPTVPTDMKGFWRIPFRREWSAFTVIPATEVLAGTAPGDLLAGRFVLVGSSALGLSDVVTTPLGPTVAGVLVHAAALSALLDSADGSPAPAVAQPLVLLWSVATIVLAVFLLSRLAPLWSLFILAGCALAWLFFARLAVAAGMEVTILGPWLGYLVLAMFALPHEWWLARQASTRVQRILSHYVAPTVVAELLRRPDERPLEPRFCNVSVLIADMEGYTHMTTALSLDQAAHLTCDFLSALTEPILGGEGTLDKYTGDGVVAFWGAPIACPDQADRAIEAAQRIVAAVADMNARHERIGLPAVRVRIGVESGPTLVGDLGTSFRSTYTAVGNCINFAAKLQETARNLSFDIIVGPGAHAAATRTPLQSLGIFQPQGVSSPIELYSVSAPQPAPAFAGDETAAA